MKVKAVVVVHRNQECTTNAFCHYDYSKAIESYNYWLNVMMIQDSNDKTRSTYIKEVELIKLITINKVKI